MVLLFLLLPILANCGNILFLNTWHSKSHGRTMSYLAEKLVERGHNVTMYSQVSSPIGSMGKGVVHLESQVPDNFDQGSPLMVARIFWYYEMHPIMFWKPHQISFQYLEALKDDETLKGVLKTPYDFVIMDEMFAPAQNAIAMKLRKEHGSTLGIFSTTDQFAYSSNYRAFSRNPSTFPQAYTKGYAVYENVVDNFFYRVNNALDAFLEHIMFNYIINYLYVKPAGRFFEVETTIDRLYRETVVSFTDYPARYGTATPRAIDLVGVSEHCEKNKSLPEDIKQFVEDPNSKGTIYVAFGSIVNWEAGPSHVIQTFVNVFNRLSDYRIIWSYTGIDLRNAAPHVKLMEWAPQNDILAHPKTVLFFTHGGLKSLREGVCSNTPLLFLPFFADQAKNAAFAIQMHLGEAIYKGKIEENELLEKMTKALRSERLKKSVKNYAAHFTDNPVNSLQYGAFWVDKILRHKRFPLAYIKGRDLNWFQYLHAESLVVILSLLYVIS